MADRAGVAFDRTCFQPMVLTDTAGVAHTFAIRSFLAVTGHQMEALEMLADDQLGYQFGVLGDVEADAWELFQQLHEQVRRALAVRHVERTEFGWQVTHDQRLTGRIEWDGDEDGTVPKLVIDGKPFSWEQVGRMLMTFEGFTLTAQMDEAVTRVGAPKPPAAPRPGRRPHPID
jgi:hypothetical protein